MRKDLRILSSIGLTVICAFGGFGFYRMSDGDLFSSIVFAIGMLGIMFSFLRNTAKH